MMMTNLFLWASQNSFWNQLTPKLWNQPKIIYPLLKKTTCTTYCNFLHAHVWNSMMAPGSVLVCAGQAGSQPASQLKGEGIILIFPCGIFTLHFHFFGSSHFQKKTKLCTTLCWGLADIINSTTTTLQLLLIFIEQQYPRSQFGWSSLGLDKLGYSRKIGESTWAVGCTKNINT